MLVSVDPGIIQYNGIQYNITYNGLLAVYITDYWISDHVMDVYNLC